jgi:hypothetical protein
MKEEIDDKKFRIQQFEDHLQQRQDRLDANSREKIKQKIDEYKKQIAWFTQTLAQPERKFVLDISQEVPPPKEDFTPLDQSLIHFYYSLFGDQWRLIADVLNYHPLTRGKMRSKEIVQMVWY